MDTLGRCITIILTCILLFLFPIQYDAMLQANILESVEGDAFYTFVKDIISQGEITKKEYQLFMNTYDMVDEIFHLEVEIAHVYTNGEEEYELIEYYDDLPTYFATESELLLNEGDYITVRLQKDSVSILRKLEELLLSKAVREEEMVYGGRVQ